jgi:ribonucleotide monophosphatase NagD (HAD superfamily)
VRFLACGQVGCFLTFSWYVCCVSICRPYFLLSDSAREEITGKTGEDTDDTTTTPYDSVVIGLAPSKFTYSHLNTAFRILTNEHPSQHPSSPSSNPRPAIPLIAAHKAKYIASSDGALSLGPGPFVAALEHASGVRAQVVGKPSIGFFESVVGDFGFGSDGGGDGGIAVIGDDVEADLGGGAIELGLWRVLGTPCSSF